MRGNGTGNPGNIGWYQGHCYIRCRQVECGPTLTCGAHRIWRGPRTSRGVIKGGHHTERAHLPSFCQAKDILHWEERKKKTVAPCCQPGQIIMIITFGEDSRKK